MTVATDDNRRGRLARSRTVSILMQIAPIAVILLLWEVSAHLGLLPAQVLVPLERVAGTLGDMIASGELEQHLGASLYRLFFGFLCGAVAGLIIGGVAGLSRTVHALIWPFFNGVRQVPVIAFIPLLILFFGVEDSFKIVVVALASFFPVTLATHDAILSIPRSHLEVARLYCLPLPALIGRVVLPATVPPVLTGLRLGLTRAWLSLIAAELLAADFGLGQMMEMGRQLFQIDVVLVGVFITGLVGFLLDYSVVRAERRLSRWKVAA